MFIPAGTVHCYENEGEKDAEFLCTVPKTEKHEAICLEEEAASTPRRRKGAAVKASRSRFVA